MQATAWAILPPIIAIVLALITKEVYMSLMIGILVGALLFVGGNPIEAVSVTFNAMGQKIAENYSILIFLVLLGIIVALISKSGASKAYGDWAAKSIKSKRGALLSTSALGAIIFVDDYFNCLTVGTVMRPVTDKYKVSRAKLAYIIDATAAPICILAPISSWAAAVGSSLPKGSNLNGFTLFLQTIPFNMYAIFTIIFVLFISITGLDFFKMKKYEHFDDSDSSMELTEDINIVGHGKVKDLIIPIVFLIISCILGMLYTGGFFNDGLQGISSSKVIDAFSNCSAGPSLVLGSFFTLVFILLFYLPRRVISYKEFCDSIIEGFRAMAPAILILCLAWTLSQICSGDYLNLGKFVGDAVNNSNFVYGFLPGIFFVVALGLAFATGTSWGTFGILIPIAITILETSAPGLITLSVAAILAGAVCGDHVSPISDTTILSSAGAQCKHIYHVSTQLPYALLVALASFIGFFVGGILENNILGLLSGALTLCVILVVLYFVGQSDSSDETYHQTTNQ